MEPYVKDAQRRFLKKNVGFCRKMVVPFGGVRKFLAVFYAKVALFCPGLADYEAYVKDSHRPGARRRRAAEKNHDF